MAKANIEAMYLVSTAGTGYFYTFRKNRRKLRGETKLKVKKYDPIARVHVLFEEKKLSKKKKRAAGSGAEEAPAAS